jgi:hypothetical protein
MHFSIRTEFIKPWLLVREGYFRLWRIEWHIAFMDTAIAGRYVTTFHGNRWPRLLPRVA